MWQTSQKRLLFAAKLFCFYMSFLSPSRAAKTRVFLVFVLHVQPNLATYTLTRHLNGRVWVSGSPPSWSSVRYNLFHICIDLHVVSGELPTSPSRFIFLFGHCSAPLEQLGGGGGGWPLVQGHPSSRRGPSVFLICFSNPDLPRPTEQSKKAPSSSFLLSEKRNLAAYIMFAPSVNGVYMWCSFSCWYLL